MHSHRQFDSPPGSGDLIGQRGSASSTARLLQPFDKSTITITGIELARVLAIIPAATPVAVILGGLLPMLAIDAGCWSLDSRCFKIELSRDFVSLPPRNQFAHGHVMRQSSLDPLDSLPDIPVAGPDSNRSLRLLVRLLRCTQAIKGRFRVLLEDEFGTTLAKWDMIATLARQEEGVTMSRLSKQLMVSNGNVTQVVNRLIDDGLVVRKVNAADRRFASVHLTPKGRKFFDDVARANSRWVEQMLDGISESDVEQLNTLLGTLRRSIDLSPV